MLQSNLIDVPNLEAVLLILSIDEIPCLVSSVTENIDQVWCSTLSHQIV